MVKFYKEYKEQALLFSQWYMIEKYSRAAGNLLSHNCREAKGRSQKAKEARIASEQNCIEPARACHAARNTEAKKSKV